MGLIKKIFSPLGDALSWLLDLDEQFEDANSGALVNKQSNIDPLPIIYGTRKLGGTRVFVSTGGGNNNEYLYIVLALCEGEIQSIGDVYINDKLSTHADYNNLVTIEKYTGTDDQTATTLFNDANDSWTSAHRLRGVAYLAVRLKYDKDVFGSIPEIQCIVDGKKVYDPRQDSTSVHYDSDVGVATQRETNSTTWKSNTNPAICLMDYLKNSRYGKSLITSFVNVADFVTAANDCDESVVEYSGSANAPLFQMNAIVATDKTIFDNTKIMLSAMRGYLNYINGQYTLRIDKPQAYSFSLDHNNITSDISVSSNDKNSKFNKVTAKFINPDANWQSDTVIWPPADSTEETTFLSEDNNQELATEITVDHITSPYIARELAKTYCLSSRKQTLQVELTALSDAYECIVGDVVRLTHESMGWTNKLFQINRMTLDDSGEVSLTLREYDQDVYTWYEGAEQENNAQSTLPDPFAILPPTNLSAVAGSQLSDDGTTLSYIDLSWTAADDAFVSQYEISYSANGISDQTILVNNTTHRIFVLNTSVDYSFSVRSINDLGVKSTAIATTGVSAVIDTVAPGVPTNLSVDGTFKQIELSWDNPTDNDFKYVEIKRAGTTVEGDAVVIATTAGDFYVDANYTGVVTRYYWLRAIDHTGNASAWVSAGGGTTQHLVTDDFDDGVISIDHIDTNFLSVIDAKAPQSTVDTINANLTTVESSVDSIIDEQQDFGDTINTVANRMLTLATRQDEFTGLMRDAGITVDPGNGTVSIQAVETLRSETETNLNQVTIDLDAAEAEISLRATTSYVNNAIASAVLDSADLASLNALEAKIDQAEIDIDANTASIVLKADSTTVSGLDVRLTQAEIDVNAAEASILLKADQTEFDTLENRVTTAEIDINALDAASITQTVADSRSNTKAINLSAVTSLKDILNQYKLRESTITDLAFARQQIFADVNEQREAIAQAKTELGALIDDNTASVISESTARANADSALASDITALTATVNTNTASIQTESTARADADSALASDISALSATVDTTNAAIATESTARATADEALATDIAALTTTVGDNTADITAESTARATADTALATDIATLTTTVGDNAAAIVTESTARATADASLASSITSLTTTVGGHTTSISENLTSIDGVKAQYSVTINNNDHVTGFGLVSDIIDGNPTSSFTVNADSFGIGATGASDEYPFVVYTTNQNITKNGTSYTIPAGTYIADAFIQNASIGTAQIQNAAIDTAQINNLAVTNGKIDNLAVTNAKIGNLAVTEGKIANLAVDTIKIADQAVTIPVSAYTEAITTSSGEHEVQSVTIAATGAPIEILCSVRLKRVAFGSSTGFVKIYRDTTLIYSAEADVSAIPIITTFAISNTPSAGTYTYKLVVSSTGSMIKSNRYMRALETKK